MSLTAEDPRIGEQIREYRLEKCLASGGMGTIFLAQRAPGAGSERSILRVFKLLRHDLATDQQGLLLFQREVQILQRLHHPNIVQLEDHGIHETLGRYICMEYITGHTLKTHLRRTPHPPDPQQVLRWMQQICEALHYCHEHGVIHRDLKPENIFLQAPDSPAEMLKLFDFGIASCPGVEEIRARYVGTPRYMSPEQIQNKTVDGRADLYSLAVILFELLTQRPLFAEQDSQRLREAHLSQPPPSLQEKRPDLEIPASVESLLQQLLAKSPDQRPLSSREFYRWLQDGLPTAPFLRREGRLGIVVGASAGNPGILDADAVTPPPTATTATTATPNPTVPQSVVINEPSQGIDGREENDEGIAVRSFWKTYGLAAFFLVLAVLVVILLVVMRK